MAYKGGVPVNSGFYPRNDFPIVEAKDIYVSDEQRLDDAIEELRNSINGMVDASHNHDDRYYTIDVIDNQINDINTSIGNITNGLVVVKKAEHAGAADYATAATQDASGNVIVETYETKFDSNKKFEDAKSYADSIKNDLLDGAGGAYDTLKELSDLIVNNSGAIEALETIAAGKANADHNHNDVYYTEGEINNLLGPMQLAIDNKVEKDGNKVLSTHDFNDGYKEILDSFDQTIADINEDIKGITDDYLTSKNEGVLQDNIKQVSEKVDANTGAIAILNGEDDQDGSVKHSINSAFNTFNNTIIEGINEHIGEIEDGIVAYKQEISDQFGEFTNTVGDIDERVATIEEDFPAYQQEVTGQFEGLEQSINEEVEKIYVDLESHDHEALYYDKDEILGLITVEDIEDICQSTQSSGGNLDLVNVATQYWVEQGYQKKGNYLTAQDMNDHDISESSHNDIRLLIDNLSGAFNEFIECDDDTIKQIRDVIKFVKENQNVEKDVCSHRYGSCLCHFPARRHFSWPCRHSGGGRH